MSSNLGLRYDRPKGKHAVTDAIEVLFDEAAIAAAAPLEHAPTRAEATAERAVLSGLNAGCLAPVGVRAEANGVRLRLRAAVLSLDGAKRIAVELPGPIDGAEALGAGAAKNLIAQGAQPLVDAARNHAE